MTFSFFRVGPLGVAIAMLAAPAAPGADVLPTIGGDQVTMMSGAPMKHAAIDFDGTNLSVHIDEAVATPLLRELSPPNTFSAAEPWSVLSGTAHNFQYGWIPRTAWSPPTGLGVFIEETDASAGLRVYEGGRFANESLVRAMTFEPLFEGGEAWQWSGLMTHNAYAVAAPTESEYRAIYRVFLADAVTAEEPVDPSGAPLYGSATATFGFRATPIPEPAAVAVTLVTLAVVTLRRREGYRCV